MLCFVEGALKRRKEVHMANSALAVQQLLKHQSVGGVRLVGRHVVWRCAEDEFAVWQECNIYSPVPPGCHHNLSQAIKVLA